MRRRYPFSLVRILEYMVGLSGPRHRDLARAMVSELDSIADPAERRRFAVGAIVAIVRLALSGYRVTAVLPPGRIAGIPKPEGNANLRGPSMPEISTRQLLRRHVVPFTVALASLTALLLANSAAQWFPRLSGRGASAGTLVEAELLATPSTMALTIPMAVFLAVSWVFTRPGMTRTLVEARRERHGVRRLVGPVLGAAAVIAALAFVLNIQILPRANAGYAALLAGATVQKNDRTMTLGELREAARSVRTSAGPDASARAAEIEVEIQKKFALAAACVILALAGMTIALRFPRGGMGLMIGASGVIFTGYYLSLIGGEALADQQVISPFVAMWMANALLLAVAMLLARRPGGSGTAQPPETLAVSL